MEDSECMACRTAAGHSAADEVYRDDRVVAVVARTAINPGHLVVVTLEHVRNALGMDDELLAHVFRVGRDLARHLHAALPCPSTMLVMNNEAPCQTVFHAHLHVVPRFPGDEMDHTFGRPVPEAERAELAARLRESDPAATFAVWEAKRQLLKLARESTFRPEGPYPTREELYDRGQR